MRKIKRTKLSIDSETTRHLTTDLMSGAVGGVSAYSGCCRTACGVGTCASDESAARSCSC